MRHNAGLTALLALLLATTAVIVFRACTAHLRRKSTRVRTVGQQTYDTVRIIVSARRPADLITAPASRKGRDDRRGTWVDTTIYLYHGDLMVNIAVGDCSPKRTDTAPMLLIYDARLGEWSVAFYDGEGERVFPLLGMSTADFVPVNILGYFSPKDAI